MNLLDLCDDLHYLIGENIKQTPDYNKHNFRKVVDELDTYKREPNSIYLETLINEESPYLYAYCYPYEDGGWWFETINDPYTTQFNWVFKDFEDARLEREYWASQDSLHQP
jgi:hypothetical protein